LQEAIRRLTSLLRTISSCVIAAGGAGYSPMSSSSIRKRSGSRDVREAGTILDRSPAIVFVNGVQCCAMASTPAPCRTRRAWSRLDRVEGAR